MATCTSNSSATPRQVSMAAGCVPQSSCNFRPRAPARICSRSGSGEAQLPLPRKPRFMRSEEHTSELQSLRHLVCRLLLEKKKKAIILVVGQDIILSLDLLM